MKKWFRRNVAAPCNAKAVTVKMVFLNFTNVLRSLRPKQQAPNPQTRLAEASICLKTKGVRGVSRTHITNAWLAEASICPKTKSES